MNAGGTYFGINLIVSHKLIFGHSCNILSLLYYVLTVSRLFTCTAIYTNLSAYLSVFSVCSQEDFAGDILAIIQVLELPTKESLSIWVSLLCLNGLCLLSWSIERIHSFNCNIHTEISYNIQQSAVTA